MANYLSLFSMNLTAVKISAMVVRHLGSCSIGPYLNSTAVYTVHCECMCSGFYQWYQWYTNIVQGSTNGTIGKTIDTNGNANGTTGSPNGTIGTIGKPLVSLLSQWYHWLPMEPLVKLPMVPLGIPEQSQCVPSLLVLFLRVPRPYIRDTQLLR